MKHLIITLLALATVLTINAQSRETQSSRIKITTKSAKLKNAIGWQKDALDTWVSNDNAISDIRLNEKTRYTVPQNFKWIQFTELQFDNKTYYVLLYESESYISASKNERRVHYYIISPASYQSLINTVTNKTAETLTIHSNMFGYMSDTDGIYTQSKLLAQISNSLLRENGIQSDFKINAQHVDAADVVRFRLPEQASGVNNELVNSYFEVQWDIFKPLLIPLKQRIVTDEFELESEGATNNAQNTEIDEWDRETPLIANDTIPQPIDSSTVAEAASTDSTEYVSERVSDEEPIVSNTIATLNNIAGWYKNQEGKWVSDSDFSYNFETVGRYEFRKLSYKNKEYLILTRFEKYAGETYYLIAKDEYDRQIDKLGTASTLNFPIVASCGVGNKLDDLVAKGKEAINSPEKEKIIIRDNYLTLQQKTSRGKNLARFFIYEKNCTQYGESGSVTCNVNVSNKIKYDEFQYIGTNELFSKMYYEVDYNRFIDFLQAPAKGYAKSTNNAKPQEEDILFD